MSRFGNSGEDEVNFDLLNDETFGELSNSHDDWEYEHEKLTESETTKPEKRAPEAASNEPQEPLHFLKYPQSTANYHTLKTPTCFQPPPNLIKHSSSNHYLEDEAELAIHESDLVRQLSRLVMENEEEEERFNKAKKNHHMSSDDSWVVRNGLQPPESFRLFSSPSDKRGALLNPLEELLSTPPSATTTPAAPLPTAGSAIKAKMTLEELELFLKSNDKKKQPSEQEVQQITPFQQQHLPQSPFQQCQPPQTPSALLSPSQEQQLKEMALQHQQLSIQEHLHTQRLSLQHQQQQLLLQLQQVQQHVVQIQQRLVVSNNPPLNNVQLQQQIMLRQQQQQLFKLQHFLQHSLQQIHHHNLVLQQQYRHYSQQQQLINIKSENPQQHQQQISQFPQYQQQNFQQQQMMLMKQQMMMMVPVHIPPQHMPPQRQPSRPADHPFYNGLMEQREKDWLIRIQLLQLHTDNPLIDDYYYTCWSMKQLIRENKKLKKDVEKNRKEEVKRMNEEDGKEEEDEGHEDDPSGDEEGDDDEGGRVAKLLISTDDQGDCREYVPVQFEGSLGKLRASSIYNPRRVLDVHVSLNVDDPKKQDDKKLKEILYKIEKGFDILLQADELHNKISKVAMDMRDNLEIKRYDLIERLTNDLLSKACHVMQQVVHIRKGVVMVTRWMPLLSKEEDQQEVVNKLLLKLNTILKKDWCHEVAHRLYRAMASFINKTSSISRIIEYSVSIMKPCKSNNIDKYILFLLNNQLSCSCVHLMLVRFEVLLGQAGSADLLNDLPSSDHKKWSDFIEVVGRCIGKREVGTGMFKPHGHPHPEEVFRSHLRRFLEASVVNSACKHLYSTNENNKSS